MAGLTGRPTGAPDLPQAGLLLSRLFCVVAGGFLFLTTIAALIFTPFDLATGDNLPREPWSWIDGIDSLNLFHNNTRENWIHALLALQGAGLGVLGSRALAREQAK